MLDNDSKYSYINIFDVGLWLICFITNLFCFPMVAWLFYLIPLTYWLVWGTKSRNRKTNRLYDTDEKYREETVVQTFDIPYNISPAVHGVSRVRFMLNCWLFKFSISLGNSAVITEFQVVCLKPDG